MILDAATLATVTGGTRRPMKYEQNDLDSWMRQCTQLDRTADAMQPYAPARAGHVRAQAAQCWNELSQTAW